MTEVGSIAMHHFPLPPPPTRGTTEGSSHANTNLLFVGFFLFFRLRRCFLRAGGWLAAVSEPMTKSKKKTMK